MDPVTWFQSSYVRPVCQPTTDDFPHQHRQCKIIGVEPPENVKKSHDWWWETLSDFGGAWMLQYDVEGSSIFVVFVGTDGDEGAVELYDSAGVLFAAAFLNGDEQTWEPIEAVRARFEWDE